MADELEKPIDENPATDPAADPENNQKEEMPEWAKDLQNRLEKLESSPLPQNSQLQEEMTTDEVEKISRPEPQKVEEEPPVQEEQPKKRPFLKWLL